MSNPRILVAAALTVTVTAGYVGWAGAQSAPAAAAATPFKPRVDMLTFMEHVLTPAANVIWNSSGWISDKNGVHDLTPHSQEQWENLVSGTATLAEASNALMIPDRVLDPQWNGYAQKLGDAAAEAYKAAEAHDAKTIAAISDRLDGICADCHKHYGYE